MQAAFAVAAAVGLVGGAAWFMQDDYEPVRVLTPDERERLKNDPALNRPG